MTAQILLVLRGSALVRACATLITMLSSKAMAVFALPAKWLRRILLLQNAPKRDRAAYMFRKAVGHR